MIVQMHALRPPTRDLFLSLRDSAAFQSRYDLEHLKSKSNATMAVQEFPGLKNEKNRTPTGNSSKFSGVNFLQTVLPCHVYIINTEPLKKTGQMSARNPFCGRSSQSLHVKRPVRSVGRSRHPGSQNMAASPTGGIGWNQVCTTRSAERFWCGLAHRNNLKLR